MTDTDLLGYVAALLVLATFCLRGMVALRALAIASNLAFIAHASLASVQPVLLLHALLPPMNICRLLAVRKMRVVAADDTDLKV